MSTVMLNIFAPLNWLMEDIVSLEYRDLLFWYRCVGVKYRPAKKPVNNCFMQYICIQLRKDISGEGSELFCYLYHVTLIEQMQVSYIQ